MNLLGWISIALLAGVVVVQGAVISDHSRRLVVMRHRLLTLGQTLPARLPITGRQLAEVAFLDGSMAGQASWRHLFPEGRGLLVWLHPDSYSSRQLCRQLRDWLGSDGRGPRETRVAIAVQGSQRAAMEMVAEAGLDPTLAYWTGDEDAFVRKLGAGWSPGVVAIAAGVVGRAAQVHDLGQLLAFADHELAPDHESATAEHQHAAGQL